MPSLPLTAFLFRPAPRCALLSKRGGYCSFAHGKCELRHKNRKFADLSCKELVAPIIQLTRSGDARNEAAFAHFRQRVRAQMPQPLRRDAAIGSASYGFGGERERRYSAPERSIRERLAEECNHSGRRASDEDIDDRIKVGHAVCLHTVCPPLPGCRCPAHTSDCSVLSVCR